MKTSTIIFRIIAGLVLLAAIAGIAYFAFNAGVMRGTAFTGSELSENSQPYYGMHYMMRPGYGWHFMQPFFGLGCIVPLGVLFLLLLAFGGMRRLIWGPRHGWGHRHCHPRHWDWDEDVPPMFNEWHRRAHTAAPDKDAEDAEKGKEA